MGCTIGQGLSGVSTLALGSFLALGGILAGARARRCATRPGAWSAACDARRAAAPRPTWSAASAALRRLYGDAGYARLRAARVAVVGVGGVGSWAAEALARSGVAALMLIDLDHVAEIEHQPPGAGAGRDARPGQGAGAARAHRRHPPRLRGARRWRSSSTRSNWPALLPQPVDAVIDACDQVRAKAALAAWALAGRHAARQRGRGRRQAPRAARARSTTWRAVTHDPLLAVAAPAPAPRARRRARRAASGCAACSRARRWPHRPRPATPTQPTTAASTATATAPASPSPPPSAWWPPARPSHSCWRGRRAAA